MRFDLILKVLCLVDRLLSCYLVESYGLIPISLTKFAGTK